MKILSGLALLILLISRPAAAQFIGYVSPQTVQNTLATAQACTGAPQIYNVQNLGQVQHVASIISTGTQNTMAIEIDGVDNAGHVFKLSDTGMGNFGTNGTSLFASGYYPIIRVQVTCTGASYTLTYAGFSSSSAVNAGTLLGTQINKNLFYGVTANSGQQSVFQTPFGSSSGTLLFNYNSGAIAGSSLTVQCQSFITGSTSEQFTFPVANTTNVQTFPVPPASCPVASVLYSRGGASVGTFTLEYFFDQTGAPVNATLGSYVHITGTGATAIKPNAGTFLGVNVNTAAAGTVSIFDLATAACTGTPSTNTVAVLTVNATDPPHSTPFNVFFQNGICVKASVAMDLTLEFQ